MINRSSCRSRQIHKGVPRFSVFEKCAANCSRYELLIFAPAEKLETDGAFTNFHSSCNLRKQHGRPQIVLSLFQVAKRNTSGFKTL